MEEFRLLGTYLPGNADAMHPGTLSGTHASTGPKGALGVPIWDTCHDSGPSVCSNPKPFVRRRDQEFDGKKDMTPCSRLGYPSQSVGLAAPVLFFSGAPAVCCCKKDAWPPTPPPTRGALSRAVNFQKQHYSPQPSNPPQVQVTAPPTAIPSSQSEALVFRQHLLDLVHPPISAAKFAHHGRLEQNAHGR